MSHFYYTSSETSSIQSFLFIPTATINSYLLCLANGKEFYFGVTLIQKIQSILLEEKEVGKVGIRIGKNPKAKDKIREKTYKSLFQGE